LGGSDRLRLSGGGAVHTAANIDASWIGMPIENALTEVLGIPIKVLNDADAAGVAEMRWGAGQNRTGVVLILTFGTASAVPYSPTAISCRTPSLAISRYGAGRANIALQTRSASGNS
jgi:hypothetical protein